MAYTETNFKTKKALKEAVALGRQISVYSPGLGTIPANGEVCVEGPHYPEPHRWYARVKLANGVITKVLG
jgi:hypothetical protein